jgi:hypothetical protein
VGNFEDAIYAWRGAVAAGTGADPRALLLAAGGGALGLRIADPELEARWSTPDAGYEWQGSDSLRGAWGCVAVGRALGGAVAPLTWLPGWGAERACPGLIRRRAGEQAVAEASIGLPRLPPGSQSCSAR